MSPVFVWGLGGLVCRIRASGEDHAPPQCWGVRTLEAAPSICLFTSPLASGLETSAEEWTQPSFARSLTVPHPITLALCFPGHQRPTLPTPRSTPCQLPKVKQERREHRPAGMLRLGEGLCNCVRPKGWFLSAAAFRTPELSRRRSLTY